jgi:hypothetical protein
MKAASSVAILHHPTLFSAASGSANSWLSLDVSNDSAFASSMDAGQEVG